MLMNHFKPNYMKFDSAVSFCHQFIQLISKILFPSVLLFKLPVCVDRSGLLCTWN